MCFFDPFYIRYRGQTFWNFSHSGVFRWGRQLVAELEELLLLKDGPLLFQEGLQGRGPADGQSAQAGGHAPSLYFGKCSEPFNLLLSGIWRMCSSSSSWWIPPSKMRCSGLMIPPAKRECSLRRWRAGRCWIAQRTKECKGSSRHPL